MSKRILIPLPDQDFDPTEVAVPWKLLVETGPQVQFATERGGAKPECDPLLLSGVIFGELGADPEPKRFYAELQEDPCFKRPLAWADLVTSEFEALVLPGGHAQGMKQYLGSAVLQSKVGEFTRSGRPVGAICHGPLVLARSIDPATGQSVLFGRKTTCLPKYMERTAYWLTGWKLGWYYRTYDAYVEDEIRGALASSDDFVRGFRTLSQRGTRQDDRPAFVLEDGNYVSARWPGDAYLFAKKLLERL
jgi:putative intracellular protease/amidase